ncbi:response regulator transcription factor [Solirubrobacter ginsenosidimutans]|uniref:Response regulator transcription factor n=1 Tax=Solirubrobacter ginsenosidimutans TaxID=490573 RepID=A0A9X3RY88_9ACTN|nr:response regulator transcription factor [Solirubrobacter ginsenosidimutans]MDA0158924.1 response regulator transcription factor [Solirubrobacter ginsenosidimutans]
MSVRPRPVRVVTVDDQAVFRSAARAIVDSTPGFELVGESADGESALELIPRLDPDIVILDVRMPGIDGIDVADRLHREDPDRIIILASSLEPETLSRLARGCGATALLQKHWLTPRLLRGLWVVHRRGDRPPRDATGG